MTTITENKKILIAGGGFAGIRSALDLIKKHPSASITLINNKPNFEYYPGLYRVVMDHSPINVCIPYELIFKDLPIKVVVDTITGVDLMGKKVAGEKGAYSYDTLVLGLGSETTYFNLPGLDTLSFGFKSVKEAITLKNHLHDLFLEHTHPSKEEMVSHFHVVLVGGGASGVELAGDLMHHLETIAEMHKIDPSLITIDIIEASSRLVMALPESASQKILNRLHKLGVNVFLNRAIVKEEIEQVYLKDMSMKSKTVIWTAGTKTNHIYGEISGLELDKKGKVVVDEYLQAKGFENVFIVGDAAATSYAGLAQTALYDGKYVARTIAHKLSNKKLTPYVPKKNAYVIPVGYGWGIAIIGKFQITGWIAWMLRRFIDFKFFSSILPLSHIIKMFKDEKPDTVYCNVCAGCEDEK
ncbi:MAG: NAD(P)/FAD-dependent oxidoreductase [Candidatus Paceibacterota bacterium]|jgi:NADH dehydrogenase